MSKIKPNYSNQDVNLIKMFTKPLVSTYQLSEENFNSIISTLRYNLKVKDITKPEPLTLKEVSAFLKISRPTVYKLINEGKLNKYNFGRATRFLMSDVMKLFINQEE
jgi:excisionase family DNA binding protein